MLRVPAGRGRLRVTCPRLDCGHSFSFETGSPASAQGVRSVWTNRAGWAGLAISFALAYFALSPYLSSLTQPAVPRGRDDTTKRPEYSDGRRLPLEWRVGRLATQFGITEEEFRNTASRAIALWEDAADRQLFRYGENGFPVETVYGQTAMRKAAADQASAAVQAIKRRLESLKRTVRRSANRLGRERRRLKVATSRFNDRVREHGAEISTWNASGGATEEVAEQLSAERSSIDSDRDRLSRRQREFEAMVEAHNERVIQLNAVADEFNRAVLDYNENFKGTRLRLAECESTPESVIGIYVFAFRNRQELEMTLAHEFGHALGMGHVEGSKSVMSKSVEAGAEGRVKLSKADLAELRRCLGR